MSAQRRESGDEVVMMSSLKEDVELSLSLPGTNKTTTSGGAKRGFSDYDDDTALELHLGTSSSSTTTHDHHHYYSPHHQLFSSSSSSSSSSTYNKPPPPKAQVVGWPPVRAKRKLNGCKYYVKVAVDGAPYLRKVDLQMYHSYHHLLTALDSIFSSLTILHRTSGSGSGSDEYMATYEDKDGDWMLLGDVPWKMFVESCKRIRLMIKSDATLGLGPSMASKSMGSS